ncbi:hypothetical protein BDZ89DRAFT_1074007 [Hymenopellis radicata]|nr:hypothetical protein BDZ89DRAFT_1074007 [Hymenopellis radicata]
MARKLVVLSTRRELSSTTTTMASRRRARKPEFAIFSGYEMSRERFMDMVSQMPVLRSRLGESYDLGKCVCVYDGLCEKSRVPNIMALYETGASGSENKYAAVSSFFFPTRYIDYLDESQLQEADNAPFAQETEKDQARLAYVARCIHDDGGGSLLDTTGFTFRWVKDYHPNYSVVTAFMDMVAQMPVLRSQLDESYDLRSCVSAYKRWREKYRAPKIMALYETNDIENDEMWGAVSSFFIPTRFIDYTDESQLQDADNAPFAQETEKDKALLADFARRVQNNGGGSLLDTTGFTFRWVKDYHPNYSFLTGTWSR